eukprot:g20699.t1
MTKIMGSDNILAILLKTCAPKLVAPLAMLFQYSQSTGNYLTTWKIAQVCPVQKKKEKSNPANYSPISLLSVINSAIKQHLLSNNLLSDAQF